MNNPISPEPISNVAESGLQSTSQSTSALGQQLLSRLVQPAGLMDLRHLPGHRTQAAAQTLLQRSQLPAQIQARYTAVEPVQAMVMPGRSRVESLALGSLDYAELGRSDRLPNHPSDRSSNHPDIGVPIGMPTLAPANTSAISRFSDSDSQTASSNSESSNVPRVQLVPNPEPPPASSGLPITTGSFRVSRQRNAIASSPSIAPPSDPTTAIGSPTTESPVLPQLANPVSSPSIAEPATPLVIQRSPILNSPILSSPILNSPILSSPIPNSPIPNSQFSILNSQFSILNSPAIIARQPEPTSPPDRPSLVLQSPQPNPIQANAIQTTTVQLNPVQLNPIQATTVQSNTIQAMPLTSMPRVALNLPSSHPGVQITTRNDSQIGMNSIDRSTLIQSNPVSNIDSNSVSNSVPRISRSLLPELPDRPTTPPPATPLPLNQLRAPTGPSIVQMFSGRFGELPTPPIQATPPSSAAQSVSLPPPDIKRIAAQVSQLLQRQLTVEHERRGLKSW